jgi:class I lanthipeptide synthase
VLRLASWNLSASDLPARRVAWPQWRQAWSGQRCRYRIPDVVHLGEQDVHIRLDLNEPAHLALLRIHLDRAGKATLTEAPEPHDYGWNGGHAHELVIPLTATRPPSAPLFARQAGPIRATHHPGHAPGSSRWLYARLYGHPDRQTDILTTPLPDLLSTWEDGQPPDWWFLRYRDPEPHLRLRIRLPDVRTYGAAAQRLGVWADRVRHLGLLRNIVLDTYYPEVGRYGTGAAMHAAEAVFAADSTVAIAALTVAAGGSSDLHALTAASFADLTTAFTGSLQWLVDHVKHKPGPVPAREIYDQAMRLADPSADWATLRRLPGGEQLVLAWGRRRSALAAYRAHLSPAEGPDPDPVLASLLHLHHARLVGTNQDSERTCLRLARTAALGWVARNERNGPSPSTSAMLTPPLP